MSLFAGDYRTHLDYRPSKVEMFSADLETITIIVHTWRLIARSDANAGLAICYIKNEMSIVWNENFKDSLGREKNVKRIGHWESQHQLANFDRRE